MLGITSSGILKNFTSATTTTTTTTTVIVDTTHTATLKTRRITIIIDTARIKRKALGRHYNISNIISDRIIEIIIVQRTDTLAKMSSTLRRPMRLGQSGRARCGSRRHDRIISNVHAARHRFALLDSATRVNRYVSPATTSTLTPFFTHLSGFPISHTMTFHSNFIALPFQMRTTLTLLRCPNDNLRSKVRMLAPWKHACHTSASQNVDMPPLLVP